MPNKSICNANAGNIGAITYPATPYIYTLYISRDFDSRDIFCGRFVTFKCSHLPPSLLIGLDHS